MRRPGRPRDAGQRLGAPRGRPSRGRLGRWSIGGTESAIRSSRCLRSIAATPARSSVPLASSGGGPSRRCGGPALSWPVGAGPRHVRAGCCGAREFGAVHLERLVNQLLDVSGCAMPCAPPRSERGRSARLGHDPGGIAGTARRDSAGCTPSGSGRRCAPWSARRGCRLPGGAHRPLPRTTRTGCAPGRTGRTGIAVPSLAGSRHGVLASNPRRLGLNSPTPAAGLSRRLTTHRGRRQRLQWRSPQSASGIGVPAGAGLPAHQTHSTRSVRATAPRSALALCRVVQLVGRMPTNNPLLSCYAL